MISGQKSQNHQIVKTPTTTSIQLNRTSIDVGFDTIMTVHTHPPHPPHPHKLYSISGEEADQSKLTLLDYPFRLS